MCSAWSKLTEVPRFSHIIWLDARQPRLVLDGLTSKEDWTAEYVFRCWPWTVTDRLCRIWFSCSCCRILLNFLVRTEYANKGHRVHGNQADHVRVRCYFSSLHGNFSYHTLSPSFGFHTYTFIFIFFKWFVRIKYSYKSSDVAYIVFCSESSWWSTENLRNVYA